MKDFVIYDPNPFQNDYLSIVFLEPFSFYLRDKGMSIFVTGEDLLDISNKNLIINSAYLTPEIIIKLKNNGNSIFSFNVTEHTQLHNNNFYSKELELINCNFTLSGVQTTQYSDSFCIDESANYSIERKQFIVDEIWNRYKALSDQGRIVSLPYVFWQVSNINVPFKSWNEKKKTCLIRGGAHFQRFNLFLNLLRNGFSDLNSSFATYDYHLSSMNPYYKFCDSCCSIMENEQQILFKHDFKNFPCKYDFNRTFHKDWGNWNCKCIPMFYWFVEQFEKKHGVLDKVYVEKALNGKFVDTMQHSAYIASALFYGEYKWIFSIYMPQRFWDAARVKTINLLPSATADQEFFPILKKDEHYLTFKEDFSDLNNIQNVSKEIFEHITNNCYNLYLEYIAPGKYSLATKLMDHMLDKIIQFENI